MSDIYSRGGGTGAGPPPTKYTPEVIAAIPVWLSLGATRKEIAECLNTTESSLKATCSRAGLSLRGAEVHHYLKAHQWAKLRQEAAKRGVPTNQLVAAIVLSVVQHNLFAAVLGDYDDLDVKE